MKIVMIINSNDFNNNNYNTDNDGKNETNIISMLIILLIH